MGSIPCKSCGNPMGAGIGTCPTCGARRELTPEHAAAASGIGSWCGHALGIARRRPWLLSWTVALGITTAGFLLDIEMLLLIGVFGFVGIPVIYAFRSTTESSKAEVVAAMPAPPAQSTEAKKASTVGGVVVFIITLFIINTYRAEKGLPPLWPGIRHPQDRAAPAAGANRSQPNQAPATAQYWRATVYELVQGDFPLDDASKIEDLIRLMNDWRSQLAGVKTVPKAGVDAELVAMVGRHVDEQFAMLAKLQDWFDRLPAESLKMSFAEASALGMAVLSGEVEPKGTQLKAVLSESIALLERVDRQFDQAIEMRGRLKERYKGLDLPLPTDDTVER